MKITLRDLFWATLVAALCVGWFLDHRWDAERQIAAIESALASRVTGVVLAVNNTNLVEVSLGSDDGLKVGQVMIVSRGNQFLGQITIRTATPDRVVGQIDKQLHRGKIIKGDKATPIWNGQGPVASWCGVHAG